MEATSGYRQMSGPVIGWGGAVRTTFVAETMLPTHRGFYRIRAYRHSPDNSEPLAIIWGNVENMEGVPVRVHDACFTSEVLGSFKCDCKEQLDFALDYIQTSGPGMVIYLQQEGRGIGIANKIAAYSLQEKGYDTVDANRKLGLPDDVRKYETVADILQDLNVRSIRLLTNNPRKIYKLEQLGIQISTRIPVVMPANTHSVNYLRTKASRMEHMDLADITCPEAHQPGDENFTGTAFSAPTSPNLGRSKPE
eukprot:TRINITY_DN15989_c0_g1::TRINITY_DN15989_c0_g1_i1::g.3852::m.3852 TRINITY_DN15989_c0_g1::TRINITY_DN15989_c0_g1_i1::g.3852  ORF type:complete len:251 (+),score=51.59,sp/O84736/RIBBA_CHLTR/46.67/6e-56,GTP_cyclohydro2/PF00925.15/1.3e-60 TRINITY_DN15989_c0_g1_i1:78-830(+)